jgi:hypothetical protein
MVVIDAVVMGLAWLSVCVCEIEEGREEEGWRWWNKIKKIKGKELKMTLDDVLALLVVLSKQTRGLARVSLSPPTPSVMKLD